MKTHYKHINQVFRTGLAVLLLGSLTTLTSCKEKNKPEDPMPNGQALHARILNNREAAVQHFTVGGGTGGALTADHGTKIIINPNSIGLNGQPVTGNIDIEFIEIYDKGAMVLQDMSTSGIKPNGDVEALNSAGEFYLNATQNGQQLEVLTPISIQSRGVDPADFQPMQVFRAGDALDDGDKWEEADEDNDGETDDAEGHEGPGPNGSYVLNSVFDVSDFGWTNLDRWSSYSGPKTILFVDVPDGYDETNCNVYVSYDGETGLAKMDIWDTTQEMFTEHYGSLPIGKEVHFIMIADIDGQLYYKIQGNTIVDNHIEVMDNLQPVSEADLNAAINALP